MTDDGQPRPYLGLSSYEERDRDAFHGREPEAREVLQLVNRETLTVVYGMSGLGKSSLLRAGLFPLLRDVGYLPVAVRLTYDQGGDDLVAQLRAAVAREIAARGIDAPAPTDAAVTLWEYFHTTPFWGARNRLLVPVLVIDQFEELFAIGERAPSRARFLVELCDLVENRIPEAIRRAGDVDALPPSHDQPKVKVILALREDFLSSLDDLRKQMPSLGNERFRLRPLGGDSALRAVRHAGTEQLVEPAVAEQIVRFVAGRRDDGQAADLDELTVEPALLSLVCSELDDKRRARGESVISAELLSGESELILEDFYDQATRDLGAGVREYVEDHLITEEGFRTTVALAEAARSLGVGGEAAIRTLVDRRILRLEDRLGKPHVEVIHDRLTSIARDRRARRRLEVTAARERDEAAARERERRRGRLRKAAGLGAIALVAAGVGAWLLLTLAVKDERAALTATRHALEAVVAQDLTQQAVGMGQLAIDRARLEAATATTQNQTALATLGGLEVQLESKRLMQQLGTLDKRLYFLARELCLYNPRYSFCDQMCARKPAPIDICKRLNDPSIALPSEGPTAAKADNCDASAVTCQTFGADLQDAQTAEPGSARCVTAVSPDKKDVWFVTRRCLKGAQWSLYRGVVSPHDKTKTIYQATPQALRSGHDITVDHLYSIDLDSAAGSEWWDVSTDHANADVSEQRLHILRVDATRGALLPVREMLLGYDASSQTSAGVEGLRYVASADSEPGHGSTSNVVVTGALFAGTPDELRQRVAESKDVPDVVFGTRTYCWTAPAAGEQAMLDVCAP